MKQKLILLFFAALSFHLVLSFGFIFAKFFKSQKGLSYLYQVYLLPGPFFTEGKIEDSFLLTVASKNNGKWSGPDSPVLDHYDQYHKRFNPSDLYRNRFERSLYQGLFLSSNKSVSSRDNREDFLPLLKYLKGQYSSKNSDSIRIVVVRKQARNFTISYDTLCVIKDR